jgi:hypothetical protein
MFSWSRFLDKNAFLFSKCSFYLVLEVGAHIICSRLTVTVLFVLLILSFATSSTRADVEELRVEWQQFLPGVNGRSVIQTSDGGFLVLARNATIGTTVYNRTDYVNDTNLLVKTDADGNLVWTKILPVTENETVFTIIETSDGGFALGGGRSVDIPVDWGGGMTIHITIGQFFLAKLDSSCNLEWSRFYARNEGKGREQDLGFKDLIQTSDGGFALAGGYKKYERAPYIWFVKTDSLGNLQWNKTIEKTVDTDHNGRVSYMKQTSDGGYMLIGGCYIAGISKTVEVVKIDSDGNTQWIKVYPGLVYDNSPRVCCAVSTNDGGYVIGGAINYEGQYAWLTKIDELGNPVWSSFYGEPFAEVQCVAETEDGYVFFAETGGVGAVFKVDSEGVLKDRINFESTASGTINSLSEIVVTDDGGYVLVGTWNKSSNSTPNNYEKSWLMKISSTVHPISDTVAPSISFNSPQNTTYPQDSVSLDFTVDEETSWMGYSLDGQTNKTITGNTTLTELSDGSHILVVYARDIDENIGTSKTIYFSIEPQQAEPFSTWTVAAIVTTVVIVAALVLYVIRSRKTTKPK